MEFCDGRCRELEAENIRLKMLIRKLKDVLRDDDSVASSTLTDINVLTTTSSSSTNPVRGCGDSPLLTCDFAPTVASSPCGQDIQEIQCGQDIQDDDPFYVPAEEQAALEDKASITSNEDLKQDPDATFYEPAEQEAAQKKENIHTSPILGVGIAQRANRVKRRILSDVDEQAKQALETSYDRLPQQKEPNYVYKKKAVRGGKRKLLPGHDCNRCEEYYKAAKISKKGISKCSKHRAEHTPVRSPKGYWSLNMPSTQWIRDKASGKPVKPFKW